MFGVFFAISSNRLFLCHNSLKHSIYFHLYSIFLYVFLYSLFKCFLNNMEIDLLRISVPSCLCIIFSITTFVHIVKSLQI